MMLSFLFFFVGIFFDAIPLTRAGDARCPTDGVYPSLNSCYSYVICLNGEAFEYKCNKFNVYSQETQSCVKRTLKHRCSVIKCFSKWEHFTPYPGDPTIFGVCLNKKVIGLERCPEGLIFDQKSHSCVFKCMEEGIVPYPWDCTKFIECYKLNKLTLHKFNWIARQCPPGSWFHNGKKKCTNKDVEECLGSTTTVEPDVPSTSNTILLETTVSSKPTGTTPEQDIPSTSAGTSPAEPDMPSTPMGTTPEQDVPSTSVDISTAESDVPSTPMGTTPEQDVPSTSAGTTPDVPSTPTGTTPEEDVPSMSGGKTPAGPDAPSTSGTPTAVEPDVPSTSIKPTSATQPTKEPEFTTHTVETSTHFDQSTLLIIQWN